MWSWMVESKLEHIMDHYHGINIIVSLLDHGNIFNWCYWKDATFHLLFLYCNKQVLCLIDVSSNRYLISSSRLRSGLISQWSTWFLGQKNHYYYVLLICCFNIYYQYIKIPLSKTQLFKPQVILIFTVLESVHLPEHKIHFFLISIENDFGTPRNLVWRLFCSST